MPDADPDSYDLVPPELRLKDRRAMAQEGSRLMGIQRNGFLRAQSSAYKRQWLQRMFCLLEEYNARYWRSRDDFSWNQLGDEVKAQLERDRLLAAARGEPMEDEKAGVAPAWRTAHSGGEAER